MTWRPADWSPLASSDPAPGDPDDVAQIACDYRDTALEIERQARVLRSLSTAEGWESEAGKVFAREAGELAGKLAKTHGRYAAVSRELRNWAPSLREAQRETLAALNDAKDAESRRRANQAPAFSGLRNLVEDRTDEEEAADRRRQKAYDDASDDLAAAKRRCDRAVDAMDDDAERVARAIRDASDDDVKDGFWDKVKGFVSDHAGLIRKIAQIASAIATALAVLALFVALPFTLLLVVGLVALGGFLALALAGEGSWVDVGFALVNLATLGVGRLLTHSAKGALAAVRGAASNFAGAQATARVLSQHRTSLGIARFVARTRIPLGPLRTPAVRHIREIRAAADAAGVAAREAVLRAPLTRPWTLTRGPALLQRFVQPSKLSRYQADAARVAREFSESPEVRTNLLKLQEIVRRTNRIEVGGIALDLADDAKVFDSIKPRFTREFRPMRW